MITNSYCNLTLLLLSYYRKIKMIGLIKSPIKNFFRYQEICFSATYAHADFSILHSQLFYGTKFSAVHLLLHKM